MSETNGPTAEELTAMARRAYATAVEEVGFPGSLRLRALRYLRSWVQDSTDDLQASSLPRLGPYVDAEIAEADETAKAAEHYRDNWPQYAEQLRQHNERQWATLHAAHAATVAALRDEMKRLEGELDAAREETERVRSNITRERLSCDISADLRKLAAWPSLEDQNIALLNEAADKLDGLITLLAKAETARDAARAELDRLDPAKVTGWIIERDELAGQVADLERELAAATTGTPQWLCREDGEQLINLAHPSIDALQKVLSLEGDDEYALNVIDRWQAAINAEQPAPAATRTPERERYMMATKAVHATGDVSRDAPDLALIYGETDTDYIGEWVRGFGFINVRFPKATTWALTAAEYEHYRTKVRDVAGALMPLNVEAPAATPASGGIIPAGRDLDALVAEWHDAPEGSEIANRQLHEHLGMTWEQYQAWAGPKAATRGGSGQGGEEV